MNLMQAHHGRGAFQRATRNALIEALEDRRLLTTAVVISGSDVLQFFDTSNPQTVLAQTKLHGLQPRESLLGIDYRPADGRLYALGDSGRLYRVDPSNGLATPVGAPISPPLSGTEFGMDFDPGGDQLRVTSDADVNFRLDPNSGAVVDYDTTTAGTQTDLALSYAAGDVNAGGNPAIIALAYSDNLPGMAGGTLYGIDSDRDVLVRLGSAHGTPDAPATGLLTTIGSLGIDTTAVAGLDIQTSEIATGDIQNAFAALGAGPQSASMLYQINLGTGEATAVGPIGNKPRPVRDIALVPDGPTLFAIDKNNRAAIVNAVAPNVVFSLGKITGLARGERILSVDARPSNGDVLALTNQDRLYRIDPATLEATAAGDRSAVDLTGKFSEIDIDPLADQIRVVNEFGQNARFDPNTFDMIDTDGNTTGTQIDGPLAFAAGDPNAGQLPGVTALAYTNPIEGATTTTTAYVIDTTRDVLATLGSADGTVSADTGQLFTLGALGVNAAGPTGFDIVTKYGLHTGLATFRVHGAKKTQLFTIDLATGAATPVGNFAGKGFGVVGFTVVG